MNYKLTAKRRDERGVVSAFAEYSHRSANSAVASALDVLHVMELQGWPDSCITIETITDRLEYELVTLAPVVPNSIAVMEESGTGWIIAATVAEFCESRSVELTEVAR